MKKLFVAPVLFYFKFWAKAALLVHKPVTIGIAGSVGKSSARNAIYAILKDHAKTKMVYGNSETGVPLGILDLEVSNYSILEWIKLIFNCPFKIFSLTPYKYLVVEMGIDDPYPPKNMEYLLSIVKPDISVSLNVSATHTLQFEKLLNQKRDDESKSEFLLRKIAEEDTKIISKSGCQVGIYNSDDKHILGALENFGGKTLTFGQSGYASYGNYGVDKNGTKFEIKIDKQTYKINVTGQALPAVYQELFAAALLVANQLGIDLKSASESINKNFTLPRSRSSIFDGKNGSLIIDSSYNSSKTAVIAFLDLLNRISAIDKRKAIFVMGDMRELGNEAEREHREVTKMINQTVDVLYCVGPLTEKFVFPYVDERIEKHWFEDSKRAGEYISKNLPEKSIILFKGSQNQIFLEEAIKPLLKDSTDVKKLCRQTSYWMKIKNEFFSTI